MYRKFRLTNAIGQTFELTDKNFKVFANEPQGLGFSKTVSMLRLGDENLIYYLMYNLDQIQFELLFYDEGNSSKYQKYNDFINFLSFGDIYLQYQRPNSFVWYRRSIEVMSLSKSEVDYRDTMLHCPMVMTPLGFWEDDEQRVVNVTSEQEVGKNYPINYPFQYGGNTLSHIELIGEGALETPIELIVDGTVTDPQWLLYDNDDNIYGRGRLIGTFDYIYINSEEVNESISLMYNDMFLDNPLSYQDLTIGSPSEVYITFMKLKAGNNHLRVITNLGFEGDVTVRWRNRYVSV